MHKIKPIILMKAHRVSMCVLGEAETWQKFKQKKTNFSRTPISQSPFDWKKFVLKLLVWKASHEAEFKSIFDSSSFM